VVTCVLESLDDSEVTVVPADAKAPESEATELEVAGPELDCCFVKGELDALCTSEVAVRVDGDKANLEALLSIASEAGITDWLVVNDLFVNDLWFKISWTFAFIKLTEAGEAISGITP